MGVAVGLEEDQSKGSAGCEQGPQKVISVSKAGSGDESQKEVAVTGVVTYLDKSGARGGSRMTSATVQWRRNSLGGNASFDLLRNKSPQTPRLKTTSIFYLMFLEVRQLKRTSRGARFLEVVRETVFFA